MSTAAALPPHLVALHRDLGIPTDYAQSRQLSFQAEADEAELIDVGPSPDGRPVCLTPPAAQAWRQMQVTARLDSITLLPVSGFRSVARQQQIIADKLAAGRLMGDILRLIAAPGFSEHHTGRAIDIGCPGYLDLEENFATTPAFAWLGGHAGSFGFRLSYPQNNVSGISYEPWHWFYFPGA